MTKTQPKQMSLEQVKDERKKEKRKLFLSKYRLGLKPDQEVDSE